MKHIGLIAIIFIFSISINAQAQTTGKFQFSSNLISGNNFTRSFPIYANSHINYKIGAVSYGYTEFNQLFNPVNSVDSYFPVFYSSDNFKKSEKSDVSFEKITLEILSGFAAGIIFTGLGFGLASNLYPSKCSPYCSEIDVSTGEALIITSAYIVGSAFGVYFIGSDGEFNKKSALATLLGSVTGMGIAIIWAQKSKSGELGLKLAFVLPSIGATIAFNIFNR